MRARSATLIITLSLLAAACGGAAPSADRAMPSADGPSDGIGVQGAWTIDVYDPDGTLAASTAFHNDLVTTGEEFLVLALTDLGAFGSEPSDVDDAEIGEWGVVLGALDPAPGETGTAPCSLEDSLDGTTLIANPGVSSTCVLGVEGGALQASAAVSDTELDGMTELSVSPDGRQMVIRGDVTADRDGTIDWVSTVTAIVYPPDGLGPPTIEPFEFTGTAVDPVTVAAGQNVQVEVELSFGTLP